MVSSCVTSEQLLNALEQVPVEHWGELLRVIESLQSPSELSGTKASPVRTGTDLKDSELIGIWAERAELDNGHEFARGLRRQAEQRDG